MLLAHFKEKIREFFLSAFEVDCWQGGSALSCSLPSLSIYLVSFLRHVVSLCSDKNNPLILRLFPAVFPRRLAKLASNQHHAIEWRRAEPWEDRSAGWPLGQPGWLLPPELLAADTAQCNHISQHHPVDLFCWAHEELHTISWGTILQRPYVDILTWFPG